MKPQISEIKIWKWDPWIKLGYLNYKKKKRKKENRRHREIRRKLIHLGLGYKGKKQPVLRIHYHKPGLGRFDEHMYITPVIWETPIQGVTVRSSRLVIPTDYLSIHAARPRGQLHTSLQGSSQNMVSTMVLHLTCFPSFLLPLIS